MSQKSRYKPYPKYKPSGVEWLGEVPEHWKLTYLKYIANIKMGQSPSSTTYNTDQKGIEFLQGNADFGKLYPVARIYTTDAKKISNENDILFTVRAPVGAINISDKKYAIGRGLCAISPTMHSRKEYLWYLMPMIKNELDSVSTGSTYDAVSAEQVSNSKVILPSLQEQTAIADFLDTQTAKIDTLVSKQERLIELLKEKRQALISHTVTKGLDPNVKMKESGIAWLGKVPEHWEVMQVRRFTNLNQGLQISQDQRFHEPGSKRVEYITIKSLHAGKDYENREYIKSPPCRVVCKKEDILLARTGATGEVITNVTGAFHNNFFKVQYKRENILRDFYVYFLKMKELKQHLLLMAGTTTIPDLNHGDFLSVYIALPPQKEQQQIADYLDTQTAKIDTLIQKAHQAITLLKERREALISAAVTGKIDVREAV